MKADKVGFWKCNSCPMGTCLMQGPKIIKCVAGMPIMAAWVSATEEEYESATVHIDIRPTPEVNRQEKYG